MKGRHWVATWLVFLLVTLGWVVSRQSAAYSAAIDLGELHEERLGLESVRGELQSRIRTARSRPILLPRAESLGLRLPADSEVVFLQMSDSVSGGDGP